VTPFQWIAMSVLAAVVAGVYGAPLLKKLPWPATAKPPHGVLEDIAAVVGVRESHPDESVKAACNALLASLLKVQA